ncbi:C6 finger domain transcription factor [Lachnellula subtilissima]|uniref:C6 finger domain transcription factor n=1 Tax=Lachnellula subtilissima TaxID=602034 RepID=A0A8H8RK45_9HELO|nr:C6 finger domain transcription factor [Lachnellula subtilissima]
MSPTPEMHRAMAKAPNPNPNPNDEYEYERPKVRLSCLQCQRRKKKCDKDSPCQACVYAGIPCTAVSRARLPRGRHAPQKESGDLRRRVARLEELLSSQRNDAAAGGQSAPVQPQKFDLSSRLSNTRLSDSAWTSISEEVFGIRELVDSLADAESPESQNDTTETDRIQRFDVLLYSDSPCFVQPYVLELPPEPVVSALVDNYLYRIDRVFKVTHAPSLRELFLLDEDSLTPAQQALKCSVLFTSVCSLDEEEFLQRFNFTRNSLRSRLQLATEVYLSQSKLLETTNLMVLQSFVIYLAGLRTIVCCRQICILMATAVRIGQCLGLDLEQSNHSPFETEMRRRVWCSIGILDFLSTFDCGSHSALAGGAFFSALPLHINDADISPDNLKPPSVRSHFNEMTFCAATHVMLQYFKKMIYVPLDPEGRPLLQQNWAHRYAITEECVCVLNKQYLKYCNNGDPFHMFMAMLCESMITTMRLLIRRPLYRFYSTAPPPSDNFNVLEVAMQILHRSLQRYTNDLFKPWSWFFWAKWYPLAVLFAELCEHTEGANVDKAWIIAELSYLHLKETSREDSILRSLEKLKRKAQSARSIKNVAAQQPQLDGGLAHNIKTTIGLENNVVAGVDKGYQLPAAAFDEILGHEGQFLGELDMLSWNNWESFVQDLGDPIELDPDYESY